MNQSLLNSHALAFLAFFSSSVTHLIQFSQLKSLEHPLAYNALNLASKASWSVDRLMEQYAVDIPADEIRQVCFRTVDGVTDASVGACRGIGFLRLEDPSVHFQYFSHSPSFCVAFSPFHPHFLITAVGS
jgi:hypothetical protein